jgi:hypothetical protein
LKALNYSDVSLDLMKMSHLYNVPSLFRICEKFLAETLVINTDEWLKDVEKWVQIANTYDSVIFTKVISSWFQTTDRMPKNWDNIVAKNQHFSGMDGMIHLGLDKSLPSSRYTVISSK